MISAAPAKDHRLAARIGGTTCGFVHLTSWQSVLHDRPTGLIDELVVPGDARGQGVGRLLIATALDRCRALGCCEVEVSTDRANREAQEFYRRCGFDLLIPATTLPSHLTRNLKFL
jgi:GNAT superfamily N-acetyltransferase